MFTSVFSSLAPHIPVLLAVAVVIAVVLIAFHMKRDGFYMVFFESVDQRWKRHEDYRMSQWARRDHQRQRFRAAMVTRAKDVAGNQSAARNPAERPLRCAAGVSDGASSRQANTPRTPTRHATRAASAAVTCPAITPRPGIALAGDNARTAPDIADPFMTVADWVKYLTTE